MMEVVEWRGGDTVESTNCVWKEGGPMWLTAPLGVSTGEFSKEGVIVSHTCTRTFIPYILFGREECS